MGASLCKTKRYKPSDVLYDDQHPELFKQTIQTLPLYSYNTRNTELAISLKQSFDPCKKKDVFHKQSFNPYSLNIIEKEPQTADSDTSASSSDVQFLLIGLEKRLNRTSTAMLSILKAVMGSQLVTMENLQETRMIRSNRNLSPLIFISAEYANSLEKIPTDAKNVFVLGTSTKPVKKTFENIQDLIFQLADTYAQWCRKQADTFEELGESALAANKRETISNMYRQLMDISIEEVAIDPPIWTDTSLIWLTQNRNTTSEEKLSQMSPSLIVFDDGQTCWDYVVKCDDTAIFLLVSPNLNCDLSLLTRLEELIQVRHLYRTGQFLNIDKLCFRLTHDLIKHYGQLGDQLKAESRNQEAQQMFLRAKQLCQILFG